VERLPGQEQHLEGATGPALDVYRLPSALTRPDSALRAAAAELACSCETGGDLATAVSNWVYRRMSYGFDRTGLHTTAGEALAAGQGVCQDYAHVMIALCRLLDIPARYVSGHLVGEGGTHAWVEVLMPGPGQSVEVLPWGPDSRPARGSQLPHRCRGPRLPRRCARLRHRLLAAPRVALGLVSCGLGAC
jgi:Transglutaminase-like superfamily